MLVGVEVLFFFFFKQKTAYEMRISDWSSDVCSSDLLPIGGGYIAPAWVSQVGAKRAKELAFLPGNHVDGRTAEAWGWANAAVPAAQLIACVEAVAARIAKIPAPVLAMKKMSTNRAMEAGDRKSTRLNSSHQCGSRMPSTAFYK